MKKSELQNGMIVELRGGQRALIVRDNCYGQDAVIFNDDNWTSLKEFDENTLEWVFLGGKTAHAESMGIVKVYKPSLPCYFLDKNRTDMVLIWKREKSIKEYTMEEAIAKMGHDFKIIK